MQIYIGSDHGGYELKERVKAFLSENKYTVDDLGCESEDACDYPEYGRRVAEAVVQDSESLGIVICGSGIGISIAANKVSRARAALCNSTELATLARQHNGANILAMGARTQFLDDPLEIVETFLTTAVDPAERHARRREQLDMMCQK